MRVLTAPLQWDKDSAGPPPAPPPSAILISGYPPTLNLKQLYSEFTKFGPVDKLDPQTDPKTGGSLCMAWLRFKSAPPADGAKAAAEAARKGNGMRVGAQMSNGGMGLKVVLDGERKVCRAAVEAELLRRHPPVKKPAAVAPRPAPAVTSAPMSNRPAPTSSTSDTAKPPPHPVAMRNPPPRPPSSMPPAPPPTAPSPAPPSHASTSSAYTRTSSWSNDAGDDSAARSGQRVPSSASTPLRQPSSIPAPQTTVPASQPIDSRSQPQYSPAPPPAPPKFPAGFAGLPAKPVNSYDVSGRLPLVSAARVAPPQPAPVVVNPIIAEAIARSRKIAEEARAKAKEEAARAPPAAQADVEMELESEDDAKSKSDDEKEVKVFVHTIAKPQPIVAPSKPAISRPITVLEDPRALAAALSGNAFVAIYRSSFCPPREPGREPSGHELMSFFHPIEVDRLLANSRGWYVTMEKAFGARRACMSLNRKELGGAPVELTLCEKIGRGGELPEAARPEVTEEAEVGAGDLDGSKETVDNAGMAVNGSQPLQGLASLLPGSHLKSGLAAMRSFGKKRADGDRPKHKPKPKPTRVERSDSEQSDAEDEGTPAAPQKSRTRRPSSAQGSDGERPVKRSHGKAEVVKARRKKLIVAEFTSSEDEEQEKPSRLDEDTVMAESEDEAEAMHVDDAAEDVTSPTPELVVAEDDMQLDKAEPEPVEPDVARKPRNKGGRPVKLDENGERVHKKKAPAARKRVVKPSSSLEPPAEDSKPSLDSEAEPDAQEYSQAEAEAELERAQSPDAFKLGIAADEEDLFYAKLALQRVRQGLSLHPTPPPSDDEDEPANSRHPSGCARTEGLYAISVAEKMANRPLSNRAVASLEEASKQGSSGVAVSRLARANQRGLARGMEFHKKVTATDTDILKFNQLRTRKKQLTFSRSGIEGYGLFAME